MKRRRFVYNWTAGGWHEPARGRIWVYNVAAHTWLFYWTNSY